MWSVSNYLFEILSYNKKHGTTDSLDVTKAKVIAENTDKRDFNLDKVVRFFLGRYYDEVIEAYQTLSYPAFCDKIDALYEQYKAEIEEYEESKENTEE